MHRDSFFHNSLLLSLSNITTGILGFMFSIILSRELGPEGMGLYGLIMPVYNLFICLISGGMVVAISKVSAVYFVHRDYRNLNKSVRVSILFDLIWGLAVSIFVFIFADSIGSSVIKDSRTIYSLRIVCPAMIFIAVSSILKGYFYGISKIKIPAIIDIVEKAMRIFIIINIINIFRLKTITSTVAAAYIALCIGELISLILLFTYYRINKKKLGVSHTRTEGRAQLLYNVLSISFPICLNGFLSTALGTASTLIVPRRLVSTGLQYSAALSMIGKFSGMAMNITFFPMIIINSISTVLIPDLSQNISKNDYYAAEQRIYDVVKIAFLLGISTFAICASIPDSLGVLFFNRNDIGSYIRFLSFTAPLTYVSATTYGILNGLSKQGILLRNSLIASTLELILLYIFTGIPNINIYGYGITLIFTSLTILILNFSEIRKSFYLNIKPVKLLSCLLSGIFIYFVMKIINIVTKYINFGFKTALIIIFGFAMFFVMVVITNKER